MDMGNYKIKINIGIYDGAGNLADGVVVASEGNMTESEAESIDAVERALLNTNKEALVQAISQHLEGISKKKLKASRNPKEVLS
jgi:hypothetical protein